MKLIYAISIVAITSILSGCKVSSGEAYDKEAKPEERTTYNGIEGLNQFGKDKVYLMNKTLNDKCKNAKIDLAVAESKNNDSEIDKQKTIIKNNCR